MIDPPINLVAIVTINFVTINTAGKIAFYATFAWASDGYVLPAMKNSLPADILFAARSLNLLNKQD